MPPSSASLYICTVKKKKHEKPKWTLCSRNKILGVGISKLEPTCKTQKRKWLKSIPPILKPNFDLLWFDIGENWAFPDKLLAAHRTGFWAFIIKPLKGFHLLWCVPNVLPIIQAAHLASSVLAGGGNSHHPHLKFPQKQNNKHLFRHEIGGQNIWVEKEQRIKITRKRRRRLIINRSRVAMNERQETSPLFHPPSHIRNISAKMVEEEEEEADRNVGDLSL